MLLKIGGTGMQDVLPSFDGEHMKCDDFCGFGMVTHRPEHTVHLVKEHESSLYTHCRVSSLEPQNLGMQ